MRIGELADECSLPTRTIRFYERRGLLRNPDRAPNGYRIYDQSALDRLHFIRRAQAAGLTLAEISRIIDIRSEGQPPCAHVSELLADKLDEVEHRMAELEMLRSELVGLIDRSHRLDPADCTGDDICQILQTPSAEVR